MARFAYVRLDGPKLNLCRLMHFATRYYHCRLLHTSKHMIFLISIIVVRYYVLDKTCRVCEYLKTSVTMAPLRSDALGCSGLLHRRTDRIIDSLRHSIINNNSYQLLDRPYGALLDLGMEHNLG